MTDFRGSDSPHAPDRLPPVPLGRLVKDMETGKLGLVRETQGGKVRLSGIGGAGSWWCPRYRLSLASPDERRALGLDPQGAHDDRIG
ncbi:hypothetical protein [Streptomyces mobaraensis]|uniref:Uncharacterized protein n=1 Tax=Streptomyces mobaraensis TaxID=35621 RepID=A0A5N5WG18_STRMB|nr:hypothetical protein [Streptomyces mobaraensis]KAB7851274.1 hypothetical protein FRZ00_03930 [Streptomyces mobaraensis]